MAPVILQSQDAAGIARITEPLFLRVDGSKFAVGGINRQGNRALKK
ncbi:MAG TPA: hypothetical protein VJ792_03800 [Candidatus Nitrosotalea sp.]|nr:hypothetical protein [Candidatus Nitrosotalea sp.]